MSRRSSGSHTKIEIKRELMGRANYVSRDVRDAKYANQREVGRLRDTIQGRHGINSQRRYSIDEANQEVGNVKRDLAHTLFKRKRINPRHFRRCADILSSYDSSDEDPIQLMIQHHEDVMKQKKQRLLKRCEERSRNAQKRVKDFLEDIEYEINKEKGLISQKEKNILTIIHEENEKANALPALDDGETSESGHFDEDGHLRFAPDGKLRSKLTLPCIEQSWEEAKRARYIRTRFLREFERELTFKEIFGAEGLPPI